MTTVFDSPLSSNGREFPRYDGASYEDANGVTLYSGAAEPSQADLEDCLANPRTPPSSPLSQETYTVLTRLTDAEIDALTGPASPTVARRAWLMATSTGTISQADPSYADLVAALDALGIIAASRWPALLAP